MSEAPGPINFTMFLTMFGEKLNGTDPEDVIRNAFACFDEEASGQYSLETWAGEGPQGCSVPTGDGTRPDTTVSKFPVPHLPRLPPSHLHLVGPRHAALNLPENKPCHF